MCDILVKLPKQQVVESTVGRLKGSKWVTVTLLFLAIICYMFYLAQNFRSAINYAMKYRQFINQFQALASLYLFGRLGLFAFAIVEFGLLLGFVRSGLFSLKEFLYLLVFVIASNFLAYIALSFIYDYAADIIR